MSLASESHLVGFVDISALLALEENVIENFPASHRRRVAEAVLAAYVEEFRRSCEDFVQLLYGLDPARFTDDQLLSVERATRVAANMVESYMLSCRDVGEVQPFANIHRRLKDALEGIDRGLPFHPDDRPSLDERLARMGKHLASA